LLVTPRFLRARVLLLLLLLGLALRRGGDDDQKQLMVVVVLLAKNGEHEQRARILCARRDGDGAPLSGQRNTQIPLGSRGNVRARIEKNRGHNKVYVCL